MITKTPIITRKYYTVFLEPDLHGQWVVHCTVDKWSKTINKQLRDDWYTLASLSEGPFFALHSDDLGKKHIKFLSMMGFKYANEIVKINNTIHEVWVWIKE